MYILTFLLCCGVIGKVFICFGLPNPHMFIILFIVYVCICMYNIMRHMSCVCIIFTYVERIYNGYNNYISLYK